MQTDINEFFKLVAKSYPEAVLQGNVLTVPFEGFTLSLAENPDRTGRVIVRSKVLDLSEVLRDDDFAKAAVAGNFFWEGTRGAKLSVGSDRALYLTDNRYLFELTTHDEIEACFSEFAFTVSDWRIRSQLYV